MANLVIIESPFKATAIKSYLGSGYKVVASNGHIRDLPKSTFGIDIENNFEPHYINIRGKADIINEIKNTLRPTPTARARRYHGTLPLLSAFPLKKRCA